MWSQQLTPLLGIVLRRHEVLATEPFPFIVLSIALADVYALLTGNGKGDFVSTVVQNSLLPEPSDLLPLLHESFPSPSYSAEQDMFSYAFELLRGIIVAAARLGHLGNKFRVEASQPTATGRSAPHLQLGQRHAQLLQVQEALRRAWRAHYATWSRRKPSMAVEGLPDSVQATLDQVWYVRLLIFQLLMRVSAGVLPLPCMYAFFLYQHVAITTCRHWPPGPTGDRRARV